MEREFNNFPPYMDYSIGTQTSPNDFNDFYRDQMFNPVMQYEQAYYYYRYLCMQMDYKLKCKEYEKICENQNRQTPNNERK